MLIREVMTTPAVTVMTQFSTATALWLMRTEQVGSIPVVDDRGALIGIIDETDLVQDEALVADRVLASAGRVAGTTPSRRVGDAIHHVVTVSPDDQIDVAVDLMRSMMLEQLPVVENDHVVGTVGRGAARYFSARHRRRRDFEARLQCAGLYFRYSKVRYIKYYRSFDKFAMKSFMHEALTFWKFATGKCMIDNTSLAVLRGTGPNAIFHDDMNAFARRRGFEWVAHPLKKPNWKAGKERNFRTVETSFIPGRTFKDMDDLNRQALDWATNWYFRHPDDKTKLVPVDQWEVEKSYLNSIPDYVQPPYHDYGRQADKNGYIPVYANYYWIPGVKQQRLK